MPYLYQFRGVTQYMGNENKIVLSFVCAISNYTLNREP